MSSDTLILFRATLRLYLRCFKDAWRGLQKNLAVPLLPLLYLPPVVLGGIVFGFFGGLLASFLIGFAATLCLGHFLTVVRFAVRSEKVAWKLSLQEAWEVSLPLFFVGFVLFIPSLILGQMLASPETFWVIACVNLALFLFLNAIPESCYLSGDRSVGNVFRHGVTFIQENFLEWFLVQLVIFLPVILSIGPRDFLIALSSTGPLSAAVLIFGLFYQTSVISGGWFLIFFGLVFSLYLTFYLMVFRGLLFERLSHSNRRKRIYEEKFY